LARASTEVCWEIVAKAKITAQDIECIRIDGASLFRDGSQEVSSIYIDTISLSLEDDLENTMQNRKYEVNGSRA
jgi:hypothetical protein